MAELAIQRLAIEAERFGRQRAIVAEALEHVENVAALDFFQRRQLARIASGNHDLRTAEVANLFGQIVDGELVVPGQGDRPLDDVSQLAHVARPRIGEQLVGDRFGNADHPFLRPGARKSR